MMIHALTLALTLVAPVHDWYPSECCSGRDCHPIDEAAIRPVISGYLIRETGEIWPYSKTRPSLDGRVHRCWPPLGVRTICLFVPPPAT